MERDLYSPSSNCHIPSLTWKKAPNLIKVDSHYTCGIPFLYASPN